ncbi:MAG: N-acetyltransferase [bacterium]|nr:N-acetyltransferase [bacterium]
MNISIRNENKNDYKKVEKLTREAFWNLYLPGCDEHYLVHKMRTHNDFLPDLDFVANYNQQIIGNIMYAKSYVLDESNNKIETISFGPLSVLPKFQRQGVGSALVQHSIKASIKNNYKAIIIYGAPYNYCKHGFKSSKDFNISDSEGKYPYGLLALELEKDIFKEHNWRYCPSNVYDIDVKEAKEFDKQFIFKKKEFKYTQEVFSIACRAFIE